MNNGYKNAMDKIALSDEAKQRIAETALKRRYTKKRTIAYISGIAACLLIAAVSVPAINNIGSYSDNPAVNYSVQNTQKPEQSSPTKADDTAVLEESAEDIEKKADNINPNNAEKPLKKSLSDSGQNLITDNTEKSTEAIKDFEKKSEAKNDETAEDIFDDAAQYRMFSVSMTAPANIAAPETVYDNLNPDGDSEDKGLLKRGGGVKSSSSGGASKNETDEKSVFTTSDTSTGVVTALGKYAEEGFKSIKDLHKAAGYAVGVPNYMPKGYIRENILLIGGSLIEINYTNGANSMVYRTERGSKGVSGDYRNYTNIEYAEINGNSAVNKSDKNIGTLAEWSDGSSSYSLNADTVIDTDEVTKIIENVR